MPTLNWIDREDFVVHHEEVPLCLLGWVPPLACGGTQRRVDKLNEGAMCLV
jgi:hypothetical protein